MPLPLLHRFTQRPRRGSGGLFMASLLSMLGLMNAATPAHAEPAHEHGALSLTLAVEGTGFTLELESPLDNLLGFEHAPRTSAQRQAVRVMAQRLRSGTLFVAPAEAGCSLSAVQLSSAVLPAALLGEPADAAASARPPASGHGDLDASLSYVCSRPEALRSLTVTLAQAFPSVRRITVQLATPSGQSQQVLRGAQRQLRW